MFNYASPQELITPETILAKCTQLTSSNEAYLSHALIQRFGSPEHQIYIDQSNVDINGITYKQPLIMPIYDEQLELLQCAVMQDGHRVAVMPSGLAKGFALYGELKKDKPVIITYEIETFFKIAQTGYAVVLVVLPTLCSKHQTELKPFDFEQIQFVINQLSKAGYTKLYLPVRPEHIHFELFQKLEQNTTVRLLNQYLKIEQSEFLIELSKDESIVEVTAFIEEAIEALPPKTVLPKGHLAKPMRWENGHFHITEDGLYFIDEDKNGISQKRFISSPVLVVAKTRDDSSNNWGVLLKWKDDNQV